MNTTRQEQLRGHLADVTRRMVRAGDNLALRQISRGTHRGNVPPWPGSDDLDFHGTLSAIWIWSRAQTLSGDDRFVSHVVSGWAFVRSVWPRFVPPSLGNDASDEAAYDCALVLRAALANEEPWSDEELRPRVDAAARLLATYLSDLHDLSGRDFRDPGFLAWNLADYARSTADRGLLAAANRFVDRAFGMKNPPPFVSEPVSPDGLFDFSSTTATRIRAVIASEGPTPFVGAWLRERVAPVTPAAFTLRALDENIWNASVAGALGDAFVVATDPILLNGHLGLLGELFRRAEVGRGAMGRQAGLNDETLATFQLALAMDSLTKVAG